MFKKVQRLFRHNFGELFKTTVRSWHIKSLNIINRMAINRGGTHVVRQIRYQMVWCVIKDNELSVRDRQSHLHSLSKKLLPLKGIPKHF